MCYKQTMLFDMVDLLHVFYRDKPQKIQKEKEQW